MSRSRSTPVRCGRCGRCSHRVRRLGLGAVLALVAYSAWRWYAERRRDSTIEWVPGPFPDLPRPVPRAPAAPEPWIEPRDGVCPLTHPVKGKVSSGIYHVPGGFSYERTRADRCYVDEAAAQADGLRRAKR